MASGKFQDAFCVRTNLDSSRLFLREDCAEWGGIYSELAKPVLVDRILVRFERGNCATLRLIRGDCYQDVVYSGSLTVWLGTCPWQKLTSEAVTVMVNDDPSVRVVRDALLVQFDRGDTSMKSIADEVNRHHDLPIKMTAKKVGSIVRRDFGLQTARRGGDGRYYVVVSEEDLRRLEVDQD
jgi:hypothetical protein